MHQVQVVKRCFARPQLCSQLAVLLTLSNIHPLAAGEHVVRITAGLLQVRQLAAAMRSRPEDHAAALFIHRIRQREPWPAIMHCIDGVSRRRQANTGSVSEEVSALTDGHAAVRRRQASECSILMR